MTYFVGKLIQRLLFWPNGFNFGIFFFTYLFIGSNFLIRILILFSLLKFFNYYGEKQGEKYKKKKYRDQIENYRSFK